MLKLAQTFVSEVERFVVQVWNVRKMCDES